MGEKKVTKLAESVANLTTRRDFLGWIGRMAGGLAMFLGMLSTGMLRASAQAADCEVKAAWEYEGAGITGCGCSAAEATEALNKELKKQCGVNEPTSGGNKKCAERKCPPVGKVPPGGKEAPQLDKCEPIVSASSAAVCAAVPIGTAGCPTNCPNGSMPVSCNLALPTRVTCKCKCEKPLEAKDCDYAASWEIKRHIEGTSAEDLAKKAEAECEKAANAAICKGRKCPKPPAGHVQTVCVVIATASSSNNKIDGKITCSCRCR